MAIMEELLKKAIELNQDEKYQEVDDLLTDTILEKYNNTALYAEKAMALWNLKKQEECERIANIGYQLNPNNAKINNYLGNFYYENLDYQKAESYYKKAIEIDSNYSHPHNGLGCLYDDQKEYDKAEEYYKKAIDKDSNNLLPHYNLGIFYYNRKEFKDAKFFHEKAIEIDSNFSKSFYFLALINFDKYEYKQAKENFKKYIQLENDENEYFSKLAKPKIEEIDNILESKQYEKITNSISEIKKTLLLKQGKITHYTGITVAKHLIIGETQFRLSEGAFLNDTSEGTILFDFLKFDTTIQNNCGPNASIFSKKPFIGSFVNHSKNNDLTLWRMYGKEKLEEAKGCAITIDIDELKESIKQKLKTENDGSKDFEELEFYKVAYLEKNRFTFSEAKKTELTDLNKYMLQLQEDVREFKDKKDKKSHETLKIIELLNEVAYLFKNAEYKYENEVRLVMKDAIGFEKKVDIDFTPPKVYVELVSILSMIKQITIGPKVERADEWAAAFHYHFITKNLKPEISISNLPFK